MYNKLHIPQLLQSNVYLVAYGHIYLPIFHIMVLFIKKKKQRQTIIQTFYFIIFSFLIKFLILKLFFAYNDPCNRLSFL
jgi:hypothetical protein